MIDRNLDDAVRQTRNDVPPGQHHISLVSLVDQMQVDNHRIKQGGLFKNMAVANIG